MLVRPAITAHGYRTAVRDYTEATVVEEMVANSYDADASSCVVLLDSGRGHLHVVDDGLGFSEDAVQGLAVLGATDKVEAPFSRGKRHYLGSYGYGVRASLNIGTRFHLHSISEQGEFKGTVDWSRLDEALRPEFRGFDISQQPRRKSQRCGTHIMLHLKTPLTKERLEDIGRVLANLPTDGGRFAIAFGMLDSVPARLRSDLLNLKNVQRATKRLLRSGVLESPQASRDSDLDSCQVVHLTDKKDRTVKATIYFAGLEGGKVKSLKRGLRGIYVRIHGRLLKQSFTGREFTYKISRWVKFENGLRVELEVDWLRDQITLSREGVRFSNEKLKSEFEDVLYRTISSFIQPQLKRLDAKKERHLTRKHEQRLELARKRLQGGRAVKVASVNGGFSFRPETETELALLLANEATLRRANPQWRLIDYNGAAGFDCLVYDGRAREFVCVELEPTLPEFLQHKDASQVQAVVVWSLGKWRVGARKHGRPGCLELRALGKRVKGQYRLFEYASMKSKNARREYQVIALEELL